MSHLKLEVDFLERESVSFKVRIFVFLSSFSPFLLFIFYLLIFEKMAILDEDDSCGEGSSFTLMNVFPNKDKGKMVEFSPPKRKKKIRVSQIQIEGDMESLGEDEIEDFVEAIKRSKNDLRLI